MTVRHLVLFSFPEGRDAAYLERLTAGLEELVAAVPDILEASWGEDISGEEAHFDFALILDFADEAAYQRYRRHEAHRKFIADYMREVAIDKVRVRYVATGAAAAGRALRA